jgi:hypothetical protein
MKYDELSRDEGSTNSSRLRIRLQRTDECQNCLEIASNAKKWKKYIILPVQETYLKTKCLLFCSNWLVNIVDCSRRFNGLTNFKFNCTECVCRVQRRPETRLINAEYGVGKSAVYP